MRKTFTLIFAIFISVSMLGQSIKGRTELKEKRRSLKYRKSEPLKTTSTIKYRLDSLIYEELDEETSQLNIIAKEQFVYDDSSNLFSWDISYKDVPEEDFTPEERVEYKYRSDGKIDTVTTYVWDFDQEDWQVDYEETYTYDANGFLTEIKSHGPEEYTSEWILFGKSEFTYNSNGDIEQIIDYEWIEENNDYDLNYKEEYTYGANSNLSEIIYLSWDADASDWVNSDKDAYSYDSEGTPTQITYQYWNEMDGIWENSYRWELTFDANGNTIIEVEKEWDTDEWIKISKYEYTYDDTISVSDLIVCPLELLGFDFPEKISNKLIKQDSHDWDGDSWVEYGKVTYFYSEQETEDEEEEEETTGISDFLDSKVRVYPNPAKNYLTVSLDEKYQNIEVEIIDLQGRLIMKKTVVNNERFDIKKLTSGVYFYKLSSEGLMIDSNKILIQ